MRQHFTTHEISDAADLSSIVVAWWDLWHRSSSATPFQSPAWLVPWWTYFQPGELLTIAVFRGAQLVALAPFYIENGNQQRRVLPVGVSISDYLDILVDDRYAFPARQALSSYLAQTSSRWDELNLEELSPDAAALSLSCPDGFVEVTVPQSACPTLILEGSTTLKDCVPRSRLQALRLACNRAARRGGYVVEQGTQYNIDDMLRQLFRLHAMRWQSRGEAGVLADGRVQQFHAAAAPLLMHAGLLRLFLLRIGGTPAAAYYGFIHVDRAYFYLLGFDPAFAFESPGVILIGHAISDALAAGVKELDFLRGQERYKYEWGAIDRWTRRRSFQKPRTSAPHTRSEPP
jgi:CelD/BcsL family acetyltransferase involved in cellulose biosynthesis